MLMEHTFVLETVEKAFHRRIVPAVALATHARHHLVLDQQRLIVVTAVLTAAIRMMQQTGLGFALEPGHA